MSQKEILMVDYCLFLQPMPYVCYQTMNQQILVTYAFHYAILPLEPWFPSSAWDGCCEWSHGGINHSSRKSQIVLHQAAQVGVILAESPEQPSWSSTRDDFRGSTRPHGMTQQLEGVLRPLFYVVLTFHYLPYVLIQTTVHRDRYDWATPQDTLLPSWRWTYSDHCPPNIDSLVATHRVCSNTLPRSRNPFFELAPLPH